MSVRVAVVTGANKGLGYGIVKELCTKFEGDVILTARDESRGREAVKSLEKEGLKPIFHQLDVTSLSSIQSLKEFLQQKYQGLDVLVNNAGIAYLGDKETPMAQQASETLKINYFGLLETCEVLFPLLRPHARVCNMSSMSANFAFRPCSQELKAKLTNPNITVEELSALMRQFVQLAQEGRHTQEGFPDNAYGFSKIGVTVLSTIQQRELDKAGMEDIVVNSCSPGYVKTDMTANKGTLTIEEGVITPVYCALLPPNIESPRGLMLRLKKPVDWTDENFKY